MPSTVLQNQLRAFSNRRVEIEAHLEAHGETSARAAQLAAYATRPTKDPHATPDNLHEPGGPARKTGPRRPDDGGDPRTGG